MTQRGEEDHLAYGDYHDRGQEGDEGDGQEGERGFVGDTFRRLRGHHQGQPLPNPGYNPGSSGGSQSVAPNGGPEQSGGIGSSLFNKLQGAVYGIGSEIKQRLDNRPGSSQGPVGPEATHGGSGGTQNRYGSFAQQRGGNDAKWYVDGCGYMWAVSLALEQAKESIWILDCRSTFLVYHSVMAL